MKQFNGERLRTARIYRGLTVTELADKVGVSKQMISQYENGYSDAQADKIFVFSKELEFPFEYFIFETNTNFTAGTPFFRSLLRTPKRYKTQQTEKVDHFIQIFAALNEYVDFPRCYLPEPTTYSDLESAAMRLREHWGLGLEPINNIVRIVEENGILVTGFHTDTDDIDAYSRFFSIGNDSRYVIALSYNKKTASRIHFDIAHELGHILLHDEYEEIEELSGQAFRELEKEANIFAAELLLPSETFVRDVGNNANDLDYYIQLKRKWRVSISAMLYRSRSLDLISGNQYEYMMRVMNRKKWRTQEPLDNTIKTAAPSLFVDTIDLLLEEHFSQQDIVKEISKTIPMNHQEIEELLSLPKNILKARPDDSIDKIVSLR